MTRETCPGKSSNGKEKRPRSRREKVSVPGFFRPSPEIKIPSPEKRIPGLGISRSGPEISRLTVQKVNVSDKTLHRSPALCKKIAQKSAILPGLRKSRVTKIRQNGTICLFSQAFHDILILWQSEFSGDSCRGCIKINSSPTRRSSSFSLVLIHPPLINVHIHAAHSIMFLQEKIRAAGSLIPDAARIRVCYFKVSLMSFFVRLPIFSRMAVSPFKFSRR